MTRLGMILRNAYCMCCVQENMGNRYICICVYIHICICVCVNIYKYIYMHIHTYTLSAFLQENWEKQEESGERRERRNNNNKKNQAGIRYSSDSNRRMRSHSIHREDSQRQRERRDAVRIWNEDVCTPTVLEVTITEMRRSGQWEWQEDRHTHNPLGPRGFPRACSQPL